MLSESSFVPTIGICGCIVVPETIDRERIVGGSQYHQQQYIGKSGLCIEESSMSKHTYGPYLSCIQRQKLVSPEGVPYCTVLVVLLSNLFSPFFSSPKCLDQTQIRNTVSSLHPNLCFQKLKLIHNSDTSK